MALAAVVAGTTLTTPDTTRSYTVTIGPHDVTNAVLWKSLSIEDQGTTSFRIVGAQSDYPGIRDQQWVEIVDHIAGGLAFGGFVTSRNPVRAPRWNEIGIVAESRESLLDNVIPLEVRPVEDAAPRISYLWGKYATGYLSGDQTFVTGNNSLPAQTFAGVTLRQALDMIMAQSIAQADDGAAEAGYWYVDAAGRLHVTLTSETNPAPKDVSDTPGAGEIAPMALDIDYDSKNYVQAVYVRGANAAGSGWVRSEWAKYAHGNLVRTRFLDAPDCRTATMRNRIGLAYLKRAHGAVPRGSFTTTSAHADGWRLGQIVHITDANAVIDRDVRISRVRTKVLGPKSGRPAAHRGYEVSFGGNRSGRAR